MVWTKPTIRVKNHSDWIVPFNITDGEPWIVRGNRTGSHDNDINKGAESMKVANISWTGYKVRMAVFGGDPAIKTLPYLSNSQVSLELERQIQRD
jgi:hypothetical protein